MARPHNRLSAPLCIAHSALFCWLAYCAVQSARNNAPWHCAVFVTASLITIVAFFREDRLDDTLRREATRAEREARPVISNTETAQAVVDIALAGACCETWWTSAGADHDEVCRHRMPKGSAA